MIWDLLESEKAIFTINKIETFHVESFCRIFTQKNLNLIALVKFFHFFAEKNGSFKC